MSRTSRVALAAATVPLALAALAIPASASSFDSSADQSQDIVAGSGHRFRMIGSTPYPVVDAGKVSKRQTIQVSAVRARQKLGFPMRVLGEKVPTSMIVRSATFHYRYNNTPKPGRATIVMLNTVEISSTGTDRDLGLGVLLSSKIHFRNGRTSGSPICKGDAKFNGLCLVKINLGDSNGDRKPGQEQAVGKSGCTITGKTVTIKCVTTNYDDKTLGANVRAGTVVDNVETRVQLTKGPYLGSKVQFKVKAAPLGPKKVRPKR